MSMQVLYVQPYVPHYRVPLFNSLAQRLAERGDSLVVAAGHASGAQAKRSDEISDLPWLVPVESSVWNTPVGEFKYRAKLNSLMGQSQVCVMELDVGNVNAWHSLFLKRQSSMVLWGHGKSYTKPPRPAVERIKYRLARRADHIMTYTESGRKHLVIGGIPADRITAVGNSTDTKVLIKEFRSRQRRDLRFSEAFGVTTHQRPVAMYAGGLDGDKRVDFLCAAGAVAHRMDPDFLLLVAGSGEDEGLLEPGIRAGYVRHLRHADAKSLADMATVAQALWMPGRVGLVAVDAMALQIPIFSTNFPFHAPEYEFLTPGVNLQVLVNDPEMFAKQAFSFMKSGARAKISVGDPGLPTIDSVVSSMVNVIDLVVGRT
ncbi:glycosyltransferase [Kineosporia babensis]|uniref:Glycosyltransferase n=1 Tax=Kineosporia babensis TaxID=499548 RepID=A0A9X1NF92_9ACTN|nr:glycosyltransferase [Kineosporia babensis]MCD5312721.1 glycosyltransferase [Kineosporia babensis]